MLGKDRVGLALLLNACITVIYNTCIELELAIWESSWDGDIWRKWYAEIFLKIPAAIWEGEREGRR